MTDYSKLMDERQRLLALARQRGWGWRTAWNYPFDQGDAKSLAAANAKLEQALGVGQPIKEDPK